MTLSFERVREQLEQFDFRHLFIEELGWSHPTGRNGGEIVAGEGRVWTEVIAQLGGVPVIEVRSAGGAIPDFITRQQIHRDVARLHLENLLIFVDRDRTRSVWLWVKRENGKELPRSHEFIKGQPGDLFFER